MIQLVCQITCNVWHQYEFLMLFIHSSNTSLFGLLSILELIAAHKIFIVFIRCFIYFCFMQARDILYYYLFVECGPLQWPKMLFYFLPNQFHLQFCFKAYAALRHLSLQQKNRDSVKTRVIEWKVENMKFNFEYLPVLKYVTKR